MSAPLQAAIRHRVSVPAWLIALVVAERREELVS